MKRDYLCLFNTALVQPIVSKNDEELWDFLVANEERIKRLFDNGKYPRTGALFAYEHGIEWLKKHYLRHIEEDREGLIYTLVLDFCLSNDKIFLDFWGQGGFLDNGDSCSVNTSDELMPPVDEESEAGSRKLYFHLLELNHVEHIIAALEKNFDIENGTTREDINKIKTMKKFCRQNKGFNIAYIYNANQE